MTHRHRSPPRQSVSVPRRQAGFTLIEVLISLALLAVVVALVGSSSQIFTRASDRISEHAEAVFEETLARSFVTDRLEAALYLNIGNTGEYRVGFEGDQHSLRFLSLRPGYEHGRALITTQFEIDGQTGSLIVRIAGAAPDYPDLELDGNITERTLLDHVGKAHFGYLRRPEDSDDAPAWEDHWKDERRLPLAVRLVFDDPARAPIIAALKLTAPPGCASSNADLAQEGCGEL